MRWPLQPLQPLQKTQLQPAFGPSVDSLCPSADSLCHPGFTTTNLSYRFQILKLPPPPCAVLLVENINMHIYIYIYLFIIICIDIHMYTVLSVVAAFERNAATFRWTFKIAKFSSSCPVLLWRDALCNVNVRQRLCHPAKTNDTKKPTDCIRLLWILMPGHKMLPSGNLLHSYWKWPSRVIVDFPMNSMVDLSSSPC